MSEAIFKSEGEPQHAVRGVPNPAAIKKALRSVFYVALLGCGILVHLLLLLSLRVGWLNPLFNDSMHRFGPGCDFFSIYAAGIKARLGESVYTVGGHVEQVPYAYAFRYAPLVAYTLGLGLSFLAPLTAYGVWLVLCELALLRNIRLTLELVRDRDAETRREESRKGWVRSLFAHPYALAALWLLFSPYYLELYVGQFTFITASLVFWAWLRWRPRPEAPADDLQRSNAPTPHRPVLGDLFWATAVLLKMMPLLYLPVALLRGRWKGALVTLGVLVATSGLYFARFPADWAVFTATNGDPRPTWHAGNQGLMALLYALVGERTAPYLTLRLEVLAAVALILVWLTWQAFGRTSGKDEGGRMKAEGDQLTSNPVHPSSFIPHPFEARLLALYAACSAAYLLCYKDVWEHHYVLLLPPLVLLAARRVSPWLWLPPFLVCALPGLFFLYDVPGLGYNEDPQRYWRPAVSLLHHGWKPIAPLWLLTGLLINSAQAAFRQHRTGEEAAPVRRRTLLQWALALGAVTALLAVGAWARAAIAEQRQATRQVVWPEGVFRRQERVETCGPAALAAVCRHYGIPAEEAEVARLAGTTARGTSMLGLLQAAQAKGLSASARRVSPSGVRALPRPAILFFHQGHFAVLTGMTGRYCYLADPSMGQRVYTERQLARLWRGEALVLGPGE